MRNAPQRDDGREAGQGGHLSFEKSATRLDFLRDRFVFGRHAANRIGDQHARQYQPIVRSLVIITFRKSKAAQSGIEELAGIIAGEWPAGAIGALEAWRKPNDQQTRVGIAEGRNRRIEPLGMRSALCFPKRDESRTERTVASRAPAPPVRLPSHGSDIVVDEFFEIPFGRLR